MNDLLKETAKFAIGTCITLCAVTVTASVAVGNSLGKVVIAGFNGAKGAVKKELEAQKANDKSDEDAVGSINEEMPDSSDKVNASGDDFED